MFVLCNSIWTVPGIWKEAIGHKFVSIVAGDWIKKDQFVGYG
jgi:thiaminase